MGYEQTEQKGQILHLFALSIRYRGMKRSRQLAFSLHQHKSGLPSLSVGLCWCGRRLQVAVMEMDHSASCAFRVLPFQDENKGSCKIASRLLVPLRCYVIFQI